MSRSTQQVASLFAAASRTSATVVMSLMVPSGRRTIPVTAGGLSVGIGRCTELRAARFAATCWRYTRVSAICIDIVLLHASVIPETARHHTKPRFHERLGPARACRALTIDRLNDDVAPA